MGGRRLLTYESDSREGRRPSFYEPGVNFAEIQIDALPLAPDIYALDIGARSGDGGLDYIPARIFLDVVPGPDTPGNIIRNSSGVRLDSTWRWKREEGVAAPTSEVSESGATAILSSR
jgi:hypothetical protein